MEITASYIALGLYILGVNHSYWHYVDQTEVYSFAADKPDFRTPPPIMKFVFFFLSLGWPIIAGITFFTDTLGLHKGKYRYRKELEEVERRRKHIPTNKLERQTATDIDWV